MGSPKISTGVLIGHTENCASCYSCTNLVRAQPNKLQSCKQPKFSTAVLILVVETKDIVLASQAVLTLYGQSQKISTAVHSQVSSWTPVMVSPTVTPSTRVTLSPTPLSV